MNYNGIFGFYNPAKKTGEIYDGHKSRPALRCAPVTGEVFPYTILSAPLVELEGVTEAEFYARLQAEIDKAERGAG
jgi:hypothetical protein